MKEIVIYGAGMVAVSVYYALKTLYPLCKVVSFIVTRQEGNPTEIAGLPVVTLSDFSWTDATILIAVPENLHAEIITELEQKQLSDYICIDSKREAALMERYYNATGLF